MGARDKLREYFIKNVGKVLHSDELRKVAGISEWASRVRELRGEEGFNIQTHNDRSDLKPGQYILVNLTPILAFERGISKEVRAYVLDRNGLLVKCVVLLPVNRILMIRLGKQDCILGILLTNPREVQMTPQICELFVPFVMKGLLTLRCRDLTV